MRHQRVMPMAIAVALLATGSVWGQAQRGTITATVVDEAGAALPGVTVSAQSERTLTRRAGVTDASGTITLTALDPGTDYVVTAVLEGFREGKAENVGVRAGQDAALRFQLSSMTVEEAVVVTAEAPLVDIKSAVTGQDITLQLTESLPTARSYQDYLQLVPGVLPSPTGNPASRSGLNYSDIGGTIGTSTDNFYYFEGINVTDNVTGTFGANLNTEIIQEQSVLTGGLPAEYAGATGLVSNVITKSGGNAFSGSVNYYFQDDSLVADDKHEANSSFSTYDTAATLGGPIVRDKAWFFASFRKLNREDDVTTPDTGAFLRSVERDSDQAFGKVTWAITDRDLVSAVFLSDPTDISGQNNNTLSNARDFGQEQGGERFTVRYSRAWDALTFDVGFSKHESDLNRAPAIAAIRNDISFRAGDSRTQAEEQLGGEGNVNFDTRGTETINASLDYYFDTGFGSHTVKGGIELTDLDHFRNNNFFGDAQYTSISNRYLGPGVNAGDAADFSQVRFDPFNTSDFNGFISTINSSSNRAAFYGAFDTNGDGVITPEELAASLVYNSTAGNPDGQINYFRNLQTAAGPQETASEGSVAFVQDNWQFGRWSVNLGVRAEKWEHFATTGENIYTFDWDYAPRMSVAWDPTGRGRAKVSAYYGRYYDPIRNNMTNFAGTLTGRVTEEQVFAAGQWVTYRVRGGATVQDAFFAPTTKTPYTDEIQIGFATDIGRNMSVEINAFRRETRDILEDYDLALYADPEGYGGPIDHPDSLYLGLGYFGYSQNPGSNFVIATLAGGERNYDGAELIFRKRYSDHWQMVASYNWADAEGNTNSDSNADFQGDVLFLDPRAPNQYGKQPGSVEHLFKVAASYDWDNGFQVGGTYRWNSGSIASRTFRASGRNLPLRVTADQQFDFAGITTRWLAEDSVGTLENPSYGILDLRVAYLWSFGGRYTADFFLDMFNVFDEQAAISNQDLVAGLGGVSFGDGLTFNDPRRYFLGARLRF